MKVGEKRPISVVTKNTGNPEAPCKVTSVNPKNEPTDCPVKKSKDGYETMFAPLEDGPHVVKVEVAGKEIPKSPFKVEVAKLDLSKVDIKGLEKRKLGKLTFVFLIKFNFKDNRSVTLKNIFYFSRRT